MTNGSSAIGYGGARLVYVLGDGGQFGVNLFLLADDGSPLQGPELVAQANTQMVNDAGGEATFALPRASPWPRTKPALRFAGKTLARSTIPPRATAPEPFPPSAAPLSMSRGMIRKAATRAAAHSRGWCSILPTS